MIHHDKEYRQAVVQLREFAEATEVQKEHLQGIGIEGEELQRALQPSVSFREQIREEVRACEKAK